MLFPSLFFIPKKRYSFLVTNLTATLTKLNAVFRMQHFRLAILAFFINLVSTKIITLQATNAFIVVYYRVPIRCNFTPLFLEF